MPNPSFFMCAPENFEVSYSINPHMNPDEWKSAFTSNAWNEWKGLHDLLIQLGAHVYLIDQPLGVPDLVFTANAGVVHNSKVVLSNFKHPERKPEKEIYRIEFQRLQSKGVIREILEVPEASNFEGAGDCLWDRARQLYWMGHGFRSDNKAAKSIADLLNVTTISLELVDPKHYHLDIAMAVLPKGEILYYPDAFTKESLTTIHNLLSSSNRIEASFEDICNFTTNMICFEEKLVTNYCRKPLADHLESLGYKVYQTPLGAFMKAGGAAACLTLRLDNSSSEKKSL
jgi:N-dimethylarginine dimethylaminohydrolase